MLHLPYSASTAKYKSSCYLHVYRAAFAVRKHKVPPELVVNFDQTGIHIVPLAGARTYAEKGSRHVALLGQDDKRQITGMLTCDLVHLY